MSVKRRNYVLFGLVAVAVLGPASSVFAETGANRFVLVQNDLEDSMKREALDAARYTLFARQARERGNQDLAAVFERVANTEQTAHLQRLASLAGGEVAMTPAEQDAELAKLPNQSDEANLRSAMTNERFQANMMRSDMVNRALKYGDIEAAQTFLNVGEGEIKNLLEFRSALKQLKRSQPQSTTAGS